MTMSAGLVASQRIGTDTGCNDNAIKAVVVRLKGFNPARRNDKSEALVSKCFQTRITCDTHLFTSPSQILRDYIIIITNSSHSNKKETNIIIMSVTNPGLKAQELHNKHAVAELAAIATPDCTVEWGEQQQEQQGKKDEHHQSMTWADYVQVFNDIVEAFPDISFSWSDTVELRDGGVTSKVTVTGTHTGKPFRFASYPPIEAKGIRCQNDPEYVEFDVEGDKLKRVKVTPTKGSWKMGPPGFYLQIGGKME